jgi:hypothetical protein
VARARVGEAGARSSLAGNAIIAVVALALTSGAVALAFVGTLHVIVGGVGQILEVRILHLRELLRGTERVRVTVIDDNIVGRLDHAVHIKVTLRCVDVGEAKHANTLTAVTGLPVSVAKAHIISIASTVAVARVSALGVGHVRECGEANCDKKDTDHLSKDDQTKYNE